MNQNMNASTELPSKQTNRHSGKIHKFEHVCVCIVAFPRDETRWLPGPADKFSTDASALLMLPSVLLPGLPPASILYVIIVSMAVAVLRP